MQTINETDIIINSKKVHIIIDQDDLPDIDCDSSVPDVIGTGEHNELEGLQGGNVGEFYHTPKNIYDALIASDNPSANNNFVVQSDLDNINTEIPILQQVFDATTEQIITANKQWGRVEISANSPRTGSFSSKGYLYVSEDGASINSEITEDGATLANSSINVTAYDANTTNIQLVLNYDNKFSTFDIGSGNASGAFRVEDNHKNMGIVNMGDYEVNFIARSLVTKQFVESLLQNLNYVDLENEQTITGKKIFTNSLIIQDPSDTTIRSIIVKKFNSNNGASINSNGLVINTDRGAYSINEIGSSLTIMSPESFGSPNRTTKIFISSGASDTSDRTVTFNGRASYTTLTPTLDLIITKLEDSDLTPKKYVDTKNPLLVSGTNIKTINGQSILGSGNITIQGGGSESSLQEITTGEGNNVTNNVLFVSGRQNTSYMLNKPALAIEQLSSSGARIALWGKYQTDAVYGIPFSEIFFSNSSLQINVNKDGNSTANSLRLKEDTATEAGAKFLSRVSGLSATRANEFITKSQFDSKITLQQITDSTSGNSTTNAIVITNDTKVSSSSGYLQLHHSRASSESYVSGSGLKSQLIFNSDQVKLKATNTSLIVHKDRITVNKPIEGVNAENSNHLITKSQLDGRVKYINASVFDKNTNISSLAVLTNMVNSAFVNAGLKDGDRLSIRSGADLSNRILEGFVTARPTPLAGLEVVFTLTLYPSDALAINNKPTLFKGKYILQTGGQNLTRHESYLIPMEAIS